MPRAQLRIGVLGLPWQSSDQGFALPLQVLRSHMPRGAAEKEKKEKELGFYYCRRVYLCSEEFNLAHREV